MRLATADDKALIERIVSHPDVWPLVSEDDSPAFDVSPYLADPHLALIVEGGCFLGWAHQYGRVECHTNFLPSARGRNAIREGRDCLAFMFLQTQCLEIVTRVPTFNVAAAQYARAMGFRQAFVRPQVWLKGGVRHPMGYYTLTLDDWILQGHCARAGREFHDRLQTLIPTRHAHVDDEAHDCYVGAATEMLRLGNPQKAEVIYNHWALFAGYTPFKVVSKKPLKIDIKECVLTIENGTFAVEG